MTFTSKRVARNAITIHIVVAILSLVFPNSQARGQPAPASTAAFASLSGAVLSDSGEAPIANAEITFPKRGLSARSDAKGNFRITGVPAGSHELIVRIIGYKPYAATLTFRTGQVIEADFMLKPLVTKLARVNVKAAVNPRYAIRLADFEERRRYGAGRFLTADVFEKAEGQNMSQVLISRIPGIRTIGTGSQQTLTSRRGGKFGSQECKIQVIVNGMVKYNGRIGDSDFDVNGVYSGEVIGLEYYTLANTPAQFSGTGAAACGTIVIWTK